MTTKVFYRYHNKVVDKKLYSSDKEEKNNLPPPVPSFLLQADGSFLLQADGSKIIIT